MRKNKHSQRFVGISALAMVGFICLALGTGYLAEVTNGCAMSVSSDTVIKTNRMRDRADGYGILATKDGGYLLTGDTTWSSGMGVWNAFVIKTDAKGAALWSKQFDSQSAAQGVIAETKRLSVQTSDGNFVVAGDIIEFYNADYESRKEGWGDVMVTKLNTSGKWMWSTMVGDYSIDFPQRLWAAPDGGVILLAKFKETGYGEDVADFDAVPGYSVIVKFDKNGKVQWSKKMNWVATDMEYLSDGSFIALAALDARVTKQPDMGTDLAMGTLPTVIRLDSDLNVLWAKSIETPSMEYNMPTGATAADLKITKKKFRLSGGDFRSVEQTPDGGFIAFGRYFNAAKLLGGAQDTGIKSPTDPIPYIAVKMNAQGKYLWARTVKTAFGSFDIDLKTTKTNDGEFVLSHNVARKAGSFQPGDAATNVGLIKVNAEFSPRWIKKIDIERDTAGYDIRATRDGGIAMVGRIITNEEHMIMGSLEPWEETFLIKADANGAVSGAKVVADFTQATVEDQSSYLISQNMSVGTEDMQLPINKNVKPVLSNIKNTQRTIVAYAKTKVTPVCSTLNAGSSTLPSSGEGAEPQVKTYPQINFDNAKEAKIETEKSRQVHSELLPVLQKIFGKVKMTDNQNGLWLTYYFPRQATVADREAVQKEYLKLGYKVDEAEGGRLTVSKVGVSLRMTFSVNNSMVGKLEVML